MFLITQTHILKAKYKEEKCQLVTEVCHSYSHIYSTRVERRVVEFKITIRILRTLKTSNHMGQHTRHKVKCSLTVQLSHWESHLQVNKAFKGNDDQVLMIQLKTAVLKSSHPKPEEKGLHISYGRNSKCMGPEIRNYIRICNWPHNFPKRLFQLQGQKHQGLNT